MSKRNTYPVDLTVEYPESSSRLLAALGLFFLFPKSLLLIPHMIVLSFLSIASLFATWIAFIAIVINGRYPRGLFDFNVGVTRWNLRVNAWFCSLTDKYPPFSIR